MPVLLLIVLVFAISCDEPTTKLTPKTPVSVAPKTSLPKKITPAVQKPPVKAPIIKASTWPTRTYPDDALGKLITKYNAKRSIIKTTCKHHKRLVLCKFIFSDDSRKTYAGFDVPAHSISNKSMLRWVLEQSVECGKDTYPLESVDTGKWPDGWAKRLTTRVPPYSWRGFENKKEGLLIEHLWNTGTFTQRAYPVSLTRITSSGKTSPWKDSPMFKDGAPDSKYSFGKLGTLHHDGSDPLNSQVTFKRQGKPIALEEIIRLDLFKPPKPVLAPKFNTPSNFTTKAACAYLKSL